MTLAYASSHSVCNISCSRSNCTALGPLGRFVGGCVYWLDGIAFRMAFEAYLGTRCLAAQPFAALLHSSSELNRPGFGIATIRIIED